MNGEAKRRKVPEQAHRTGRSPQIKAKADGRQRKQDVGWGHDDS